MTAALHEYLSDCGLYCGVDISPEAVAFCRSRFLRPNFSFAVSRMTTLPTLRDRFHFIVFYSVFTHTYPRETALLLVEANRLLADGGVIFADLFAAPLVDQFAGDRGMMEINPDPLLRMLDASGLRAEAVLVHPGERSSQRVFYKITRKPSAAGDGIG